MTGSIGCATRHPRDWWSSAPDLQPPSRLQDHLMISGQAINCTPGPHASDFVQTPPAERPSTLASAHGFGTWGGTVACTRKVVVYCDDPVNVAGLRAVLEAAGAGPTAACAAVTDLRRLAVREAADVLLIDDSYGTLDPAWLREATAHARMRKLEVVLLVSGPHAAENALRAAHAGVSAVAHRSHDPRLLALAVTSARSGRRWIDPQLAVEIILGNVPARAAALRDRLTPRENQVLDGICAGLSNAELAETLCISARTIKFHVSNVLAKLGVRSREQAIAISFDSTCPVPENRAKPVLQTVAGATSEP